MLNFELYLICLLLIFFYIILNCDRNLNYTCESFSDNETNESNSDKFINYMLKDKILYTSILTENIDLVTYLSKDVSNNISKFIENKDNKIKIYKSIRKYIDKQAGKNNKLTNYISQNGLKMEDVIYK